jgi:hypothetical protein
MVTDVHPARVKADLGNVSDGNSRGAAIKRRFDALGISGREWRTETGIDRKTLARAIEDNPSMREKTYTAIETALDHLERHNAGMPDGAIVETDPSSDLVTVRLEGNFGVKAVVEGPVRDLEALEELVSHLVREMKGEVKDGA